MSASPNRTVSAAKRSVSMVRKVEILHRGSEAIAAKRRGDADEERHLVFLIGADDEGEDGESGEAQHANMGRGP